MRRTRIGSPARGLSTHHVAMLALRGLDPRDTIRRPALLALEFAALAATVLFVLELPRTSSAGPWLIGQVALWLWLAMLAISAGMATAEAGTLARARRLRALQSDIPAKLLVMPHDPREDWLFETVTSETLDAGDVVLVQSGDIIPADGEVIDGVAEVDESSVTGESAPVIRESGGDRSAVIGGTRVLSDWLKVKVTADLGHGMFAQVSDLITGSQRQLSPKELWLTMPLLAVALLAAAFLLRPAAGTATGLELAVLLVATFGAMLPTATTALRSILAIVGIGWLARINVIAKSGEVIEAAGSVDTLLLDKTGTITLGNRRVEAIVPLPGVAEDEAAEVAYLASLGDGTPEGRSIVAFARERFDPGPAPVTSATLPFSAATRMSGVTLRDGTELRKGEPGAILRHLHATAGGELQAIVERIARSGGTPLAVCRHRAVIAVVHLHDVVRPGMRARCEELRQIGVRTVMVTGDNRLTAATVAVEAGVDEFVAEASAQDKLNLLRRQQELGRRVGVCGDGANDAPALARADLGIALGHGAAAAREAGNMVSLDGDPMRLIETIRDSRRLAAVRRALTGLALGADIAKCLFVLCAAFTAWTVGLSSAALAACMFGALVILILAPPAIHIARSPSFARRRTDMVAYGIVGALVTPVALVLLQGVIRALGLA